MDYMATPTGTPLGPASRPTLSLQSMIQSPTAQDKAVMWDSAYGQLTVGGLYQAAPQPTTNAQPAAPPTYVAQVPGATASAPVTTAYQVAGATSIPVNPLATATYQVAPTAPPPVQMATYQVPQQPP